MNNYQKLVLIYANSFDKVYTCISRKDRRKYIMKFINISVKEFQKQNRQVQLYRKLHHENLIYMEQCFDYQQQNMRYIVTVMEYCSEGNLDGVIGNPCYDFIDLLTFMVDISKAVLYLHNNKVVHRDIKAENVLLMRNKIKITDFGLSKVMITNKSNRSSNMTKGIGTQSYMSPEMLDSTQKYSYQVDIWAMGILFIEMIVGERISLLQQGQFPQKKPDFPNEKLRSKIRWPVLKRIIQNMVKRDRHHRWKIDQIVEELSAFARMMSAQAKKESITITLPLIICDLNLSPTFKKVYRIDLGKKSVQLQQIKLKTVDDEQITIIYNDYEELMILQAWGYQLEYTYNMLQPEIREKFANLNDVFCQLKKQDGKLQLQTTGFIIGTICYRIKQDMFEESEIQQTQKIISKNEIKMSHKSIHNVKNEKQQQKSFSFQKEDQEQEIVEPSTNVSTSRNVNILKMSHRQKNKLHCHYIKFIHKSNSLQPNQYQPSGESEQVKSIKQREDDIKILLKSKQQDTDQLFLRYRQIGYEYLQKGQHKMGVMNLRKAKDIWEKNKKEKNQDYIHILETIGELQLRFQNYHQSLVAFDQSISLRRKMNAANLADIECRTFNFIGIIFYQLSQYEKALQNLSYSLDILMKKKEEEYQYYRGVVYNNIANIYNIQFKDTDAIVSYAQAINSFSRTFNSNYTKNIVESCESLCGIYFSHKNYENGTEYFERMLITIDMEGNIKSEQNIQYIKQCFCEWFGPLITKQTNIKISAVLQQKLIDIFCSYFQETPFFVQTCFKFKTDAQ